LSFADTLQWAQENGYLDEDVSYETCVTDDYLP